MSFRYLKQTCPICRGYRNDCRTNGKGLYFCLHDQVFTEYIFRGYDRNGFGMYSLPKNDKDKGKERKESKQSTKSQPIVIADSDRNKAAKALAQQLSLATSHFNHLLDCRKLSADFVDSWGFKTIIQNDEPFRFPYQYPGVKDGMIISKLPGLMIPIKDVNGNTISYQVMTSDSKCKYVWGSPIYTNKGKITCHNELLELPLQVIDKGTNIVGLCEGTLKPLIASELHEITFIGASGGNFLSSPKTLLKTLQALETRYGTLQIIIFPDAGALLKTPNGNTPVLNKNIDLADHLHKNYNVQIAYWGHLGSKDFDEVDEIKAHAYELKSWNFLHNFGTKTIKTLTEEDKKYLLKWQPELIRERLEQLYQEEECYKQKPTQVSAIEKTVLYTPGNLPPYNEREQVTYTFNESDRDQWYIEGIKKGYPTILDVSNCGTGKSHTVGELKARDLGGDHPDNNMLVYFIQQPRNPTTNTLEDNFHLFPSRHEGLLHAEGELPSGKPRTKRGTLDNHDVIGNCHIADTFVKLRHLNLEDSPCKSCIFAKECAGGVGKKIVNEQSLPYGYQYQRNQALNNHTELRATISGFNHTLMATTKNWYAIIDEYPQTLTPNIRITLSLKEVRKGIDFIKRKSHSFAEHYLDGVFTSVIKVMTGLIPSGKWGIDHNDIIDLLPDVTHDDKLKAIQMLENIKADVTAEFQELLNGGKRGNYVSRLEHVERMWMLEFFLIWSGKVDGAFHLSRDVFTLSLRDEGLLDTLNNFKHRIFQSATGNRKELSEYIQVKQDNILVGQALEKSERTVRITQIIGMGNPNGYNRSNHYKKRVSALRGALRDKYKKLNQRIGFIEWKRYAGKTDLTHLSTGIGSNQFRCKHAVVSMGIPCPNLSAIVQDYRTITGRDPDDPVNKKDFNQYVSNIRGGHLKQELGRLREARRSEILDYYIVTEDDLSFLEDAGYEVTQVHVGKFGRKTVSKRLESKFKAYETALELIAMNKELTKINLKKQGRLWNNQLLIDVDQKTLKQTFNEFFTNMEQIRNFMEEEEIDLQEAIVRTVATADPENRADIQEMLEIYVPACYVTFCKAVENRVTEQDVDCVKTMGDLEEMFPEVEWSIIKNYHNARQHGRVRDKLAKYNPLIQKLWIDVHGSKPAYYVKV